MILDGHKLHWHGRRVADWLDGNRITPIEIEMAITNKCNYSCVYCYRKLQKNKGKILTKESIFRFLDDAAEACVKSIALIGDGENTCHPAFYDTILHGYNNGLDISVGTNGFALQYDRLEDILPKLTYLRFNISAGEEFRYAEIHGCKRECYDKVINIINKCVSIKKEKSLGVTIGLQMVLLPKFIDQVIPLVQLGKNLCVDYLVIKHCSDDENHTLGVDYSQYENLVDTLKEAEKYSTDNYLVKAKWSKIMSGGIRNYSRCFGPQFLLQISGSGLVAPCGMLFNDKHKEYHIGNIAETSFREILESKRYWDIMGKIASDNFNVNTMCGSLCMQHSINQYLYDIKDKPEHINFV